MEEKALIRQLKAMREIKPRKDWVVLTKSQILGEESHEKRVSFAFPVFHWKWALAPVLAVALVVIGLLVVNLVTPGDKTIEIVEEPNEEPIVVESADSEKVAEMIQKTDDLVVALNELTETIKATPNLAEGAADDIAKVEREVAQLGELLAVLQAQAEEPEEQELKQQVEYLISDLETRTLNEEQKALLESAKADYEAGDFGEAIEKLLEI